MIQEDAMNIYADRKGKDTGKAPERSAKGASCAGKQTPQSKSFSPILRQTAPARLKPCRGGFFGKGTGSAGDSHICGGFPAW